MIRVSLAVIAITIDGTLTALCRTLLVEPQVYEPRRRSSACMHISSIHPSCTTNTIATKVVTFRSAPPIPG